MKTINNRVGLHVLMWKTLQDVLLIEKKKYSIEECINYDSFCFNVKKEFSGKGEFIFQLRLKAYGGLSTHTGAGTATVSKVLSRHLVFNFLYSSYHCLSQS